MNQYEDQQKHETESGARSLSSSSRQYKEDRIDFKLAVKGIILKEQPKKIKRDQIKFNEENQ